MTLKELLTGALLQLDRGTDAQTLEKLARTNSHATSTTR
jgi:hypothetical protein